MNTLRPMLQEFNDSQRKIIEALTRLRLQKKLDNYILVETEKLERKELVAGYPYWLTIDPANFCNLKCPFCPTGQGRNSRTKRVLSLDSFKKIIDEIGPYLIHIDFCNWGEPLLNKDLSEMIRYSKGYSIDTKIDTNLNILTEEDAEGLILAGLDRIIVSIDGFRQETYSRYRIGGDYNKVIENLKVLIKKKRELGKSNPHITWQFLVFRHNEHEIEDVKRFGNHLGVDHVGITNAFIGDKDWIPLNDKYSNYKKEEINEDYTSKHFKEPQRAGCNWLWEAVAINPNGSVSPCCSVEDEKDDFGSVFQQPFKEIWNNERYRKARGYIKHRNAAEPESDNICLKCRHSGMINLDIFSCSTLFI